MDASRLLELRMFAVQTPTVAARGKVRHQSSSSSSSQRCQRCQAVRRSRFCCVVVALLKKNRIESMMPDFTRRPTNEKGGKFFIIIARRSSSSFENARDALFLPLTHSSCSLRARHNNRSKSTRSLRKPWYVRNNFVLLLARVRFDFSLTRISVDG